MAIQFSKYTARSAKRGEAERARQREMIAAAGGWYNYLKGERLKREAAAADTKARAEGQAEAKGGDAEGNIAEDCELSRWTMY